MISSAGVRRVIVTLGIVGSLAAAGLTVRAAALWAATAAPLEVAPVSVASVQDALAQERARSAALEAQLASLEASATELQAALEADLVSGFGIDGGDYGVLVNLSEAPDQRLRMCDLAARLHLSPSGLTRRLDGLVKAGYVARQPSEQDRRVTLAVLTDAGRSTLEAAARCSGWAACTRPPPGRARSAPGAARWRTPRRCWRRF